MKCFCECKKEAKKVKQLWKVKKYRENYEGYLEEESLESYKFRNKIRN